MSYDAQVILWVVIILVAMTVTIVYSAWLGIGIIVVCLVEKYLEYYFRYR